MNFFLNHTILLLFYINIHYLFRKKLFVQSCYYLSLVKDIRKSFVCLRIVFKQHSLNTSGNLIFNCSKFKYGFDLKTSIFFKMCFLLSPKGDKGDINNYGGIALLTCLGKLFTSVINTRLNRFANETNLINENQTAFRKTYSTPH